MLRPDLSTASCPIDLSLIPYQNAIIYCVENEGENYHWYAMYDSCYNQLKFKQDLKLDQNRRECPITRNSILYSVRWSDIKSEANNLDNRYSDISSFISDLNKKEKKLLMPDFLKDYNHLYPPHNSVFHIACKLSDKRFINLLLDEKFIADIDQENFSALLDEKSIATSFTYLVDSVEGCEFIKKAIIKPELKKAITSETLCARHTDAAGPLKNTSALYWLCKTEAGLDVIENHA